MQHEQWERRWELNDLAKAELGRAVALVSPSVRAQVVERLCFPLVDRLESVASGTNTLIVIGGGSLIDRAKVFRREQWPALRLVAIPSLWGSGAEVSPVAVLNDNGKQIHFSDDLIPDYFVVWPELAKHAPAELLRWACGDVWAHAMEAFTSPLANDDQRRQAAELMNAMADFPLGFDARWFDASAAACLLQARSSVGLIHGFAHTLEPKIGWGHARLCSLFLLPVLRFNLSRSPKVEKLAVQFGLELNKVEAVARELFSGEDYAQAMAEAAGIWETIARDRCSRTNCVLVRRDSLEFFQNFQVTGASA